MRTTADRRPPTPDSRLDRPHLVQEGDSVSVVRMSRSAAKKDFDRAVFKNEYF